MSEEQFLHILKNIEASLQYNDWVHAREYVRLEIQRLQENKKA